MRTVRWEKVKTRSLFYGWQNVYGISQLPCSSSFPNMRLFLSSKVAVSTSNLVLFALSASDWRIQWMRLLGTKCLDFKKDIRYKCARYFSEFIALSGGITKSGVRSINISPPRMAISILRWLFLHQSIKLREMKRLKVCFYRKHFDIQNF